MSAARQGTQARARVAGSGQGFLIVWQELGADVEKVRTLRAGLGDHAMALASGVTPENVRIYLPYVQAFLVGTGIEQRPPEGNLASVWALDHERAPQDCMSAHL